MAQRQEQPQVAYVHASQAVQEQTAPGNAMVRTMSQRSDPIAAAKYGLGARAASLLMAFVFVRTAMQREVARIRRPRRY